MLVHGLNKSKLKTIMCYGKVRSTMAKEPKLTTIRLSVKVRNVSPAWCQYAQPRPSIAKKPKMTKVAPLKKSRVWPCTVPAYMVREHGPSKAEKRMLTAATCLLDKVRGVVLIWPSMVPACPATAPTRPCMIKG